MGNEFKGLDSHSAEWFGDSRDYWWNEDYLAFILERWGMTACERVLDVGSGVGHWGRLLARILSKATFVGVEPDELWVRKASERAAALGLGERMSYRIGTAEALPAESASFDLVTCQTVLMHLAEPERALREMLRVTKPGGFLLVAEPNNIVGPVLFDAVAIDEPIDETLEVFRFQLICQRGKQVSGEGDSFFGERMIKHFHALGLERIDVRICDRCHVYQPPYETPAERANLEEYVDVVDRKLWVWTPEQTRRYFVAGGGRESDFERIHQRALEQRERTAQALREGRYATTGGNLHYLASGRKPANGTS